MNSSPGITITFDKIIITPEQSSYISPNGNLDVHIGMITNNNNIVTNLYHVEWKLKKIDDTDLRMGTCMAKIGTYDTKINITNMQLNSVYVLELRYGLYEQQYATIYTGDINNLILIDENFIFLPGRVKTYGDVIFDSNSRKIKLPPDWKVLRTLGNGIIDYNNNLYIFSPKHIFTSVNVVSNNISFVPFFSYPPQLVQIDIIPKIKKISPYTYSINPPTKIKIIFKFDKLVYNSQTKLYDVIKPINDEYFTSSGPISEINLLTINNKLFTSVEFEYQYFFN